MAKVKKEKSLYKISILAFSIVCIIAGVCFLSYVYRSLITYENNLEENIIATMIDNGTLSENYKIDFEVNKYDNDVKNVELNLKKIYRNKNIKLKKVKAENNGILYEIYLDKTKITDVLLSVKSTTTKLGLLKINEWKTEKINYYFKDGFYNYEITIPENYKLYINNKEVTESGKINEDSSLAKLAKYTKINGTKTYELDKFVSEPVFTIKDISGTDIKYQMENNKIEIVNDLKPVKYEELKLKNDFKLINLAENWSLFLTNDLGGQLHGLYKLTPYLINGTDMYKKAYDWATQVDITFTSNHYLLNPAFTNESVKNCYQYNDDAFSCEVYLEKNLVVRGETKVLPAHDRMYIVYYEDQYRLIDMKSITE